MHRLVIGLCGLALFIAFTDRVNLSVAVLGMQRNFGWSETTKGLVLAAFFVGYLLFQVPGGWLAGRVGGRRVLGGAVLLWSLFTLLTPLAASVSLGALIVARIALGIGEAAAFPASFRQFATWVPAAEHSRAVGFVTGGVALGTMVALLVTGELMRQFGWPSAFYTFGSLGFVWAVAWFALVPEAPPRAHVHGAGGAPVPWRKLLTAPAVIALIVNHFCVNWNLYLFAAWLPSYFQKVEGLSISGAGLASVAPWGVMFVVVNAVAALADELLRRGARRIVVRKSMQAIGLLGAAAALFAARYGQGVAQAIGIMCLALGSLAFCYSGFGPNQLDIAPAHADVLFGITNTLATLPGIFGVAITGWLVDLTHSYTATFVLAATINVIGTIVWLLFAAATPVVESIPPAAHHP